MKKLTPFFLSIMVLFSGYALAGETKGEIKMHSAADNYEIATLAGGCFWCVESDLEKVEGIEEVISGYSGGHLENPTYEQVSSGVPGILKPFRFVSILTR